MRSLLKTTIALVLMLVIAFGVRELIFAQEDSSLLVSVANNSLTSGAEKEILQLLVELRSISFNAELFQSPAFGALIDFGVELKPQPVGRPNPFAPLGEDVEIFDDGLGDLGELDNIDF